MTDVDELQALRLAAVSAAALANTRATAAAQRIGRDHPYWTAAYQDVVGAVEREMDLRERLGLAAERVAALEGQLEACEQHVKILQAAGK